MSACNLEEVNSVDEAQKSFIEAMGRNLYLDIYGRWKQMKKKSEPLGGEAERLQMRFDFLKDGNVPASVDFAVDIQASFYETVEKDAFLTFLADSSHRFYMEIAKIIKSRP